MNTGVCNRISFSSLPVFHLGFFLREMGERYRREMLAHGGAKEPMLMVEGRFNLFVTNTNRISCLPTNICKAPFCANSLRFPPRLWSCQSIGVLPHEFFFNFFFKKGVSNYCRLCHKICFDLLDSRECDSCLDLLFFFSHMKQKRRPHLKERWKLLIQLLLFQVVTATTVMVCPTLRFRFHRGTCLLV